MAKSALKFKDSVAQYERIAAEVAARRFSGIYLLMGEESYFIDALSDQLAATILDEAARAFNQITVYGRDSEAGQVINLCRQMPMMGQYQVVILKEAQQLKGLDKLALYTQKPSPTTILVICHKEKNADKRSAFYKGCAANGTVLESVRPRDYEIAAWLQQFIRQKGFTIDPKGAFDADRPFGEPTSQRSPTKSGNSPSRCPRARSASPTPTSRPTSAFRRISTTSNSARRSSPGTWPAR